MIIMIKYTLSEDGKTMLSINGSGKLVVPPTVEDFDSEGIKSRNQLCEIVFSEGCTRIGPGWDIDAYVVIDHCAILNEITLPSSMKEVDENAFSNFDCIEYVWVPVGMKDYFKRILPKHLAKYVVEQIP